MREMDPLVWFGKRELDSIPRHFIKCQTPITTESKQWIMTSVRGRYTISNALRSVTDPFGGDANSYLYVEDSKDAMIYELRWSGNK